MYDVGIQPRERAIVVSVTRKGIDPDILTEHLDELELLLDTAGADVAARLYQERERPDVATALGKGKVAELLELVKETGVQLVVFDNDLTAVQARNLENELKVKVMDRSGVILDIFASNARSVEARTQVELAQLEYLFPRLTRMWTHLSKQFGGIGTKGPGETQIETDRRMYRIRMQRLREKLKEIDTQRALQRSGRSGLPRFALVGYTNAGKSSLMRAIAGAEVHIEDRLFATLDTTVRAFELPSRQKALLSDTVGFIRKLPPQLIASFRSTLAETLEADVLIHVVDVTSKHVRDHIDVVMKTLHDLEADQTPTIIVFNKIDVLEDRMVLDDLEASHPGCIYVSAQRGINIQRLLQKMQDVYEETSIKRLLLVPYEQMREVSRIYEDLEVIAREDLDAGVQLSVKVPMDKLRAFRQKYGGFIADLPDHSAHGPA